ncbi:MAG: FKBP-type peptidyl-prolyl cis-trans isomerase [Planctomycetes bacterium]|nr:FKBP-type peptidyl-prolyl cis-trans isomerase [Planctomycetota bacterium]
MVISNLGSFVLANAISVIILTGCSGTNNDFPYGERNSQHRNSQLRDGKVNDMPGINKPAKPGKPDKDAPKKFTKTKSGLKYRILRKSPGKKPGATDSVTVHYRGWLPDKTGKGGKEFDSSYKRGKPATFPLNGVIKGWTEGLQLIGEGGMIELEVPPHLGYGDAGGGGGLIPPKATLRFLVELIKVH